MKNNNDFQNLWIALSSEKNLVKHGLSETDARQKIKHAQIKHGFKIYTQQSLVDKIFQRMPFHTTAYRGVCHNKLMFY